MNINDMNNFSFREKIFYLTSKNICLKTVARRLKGRRETILVRAQKLKHFTSIFRRNFVL